DSLDVLAVRGGGGMLGTLLLALFLSGNMGGVGYADNMAVDSQFVAQVIGVVVVAIPSARATARLGRGGSILLPMRASEDAERAGLDIANHGERAWDLD